MEIPPLSATQLERFERVLERRAGLVFTEKNRDLLPEAVKAGLDVAGPLTLEELLAKLMDPTDDAVLEAAVAALTPGETYFYRNRPHFDVLEKRILPVLLEQRSAVKCLRMWSAGCSTGEEAYSIAIALYRTIENLGDWKATVLATDVNAAALAKAREALYSEWSFRGTGDDFRTLYFDATKDGWRVKEEIRRLVVFAVHNLVTDPYPSTQTNTKAMDVIFCRNVTIYFDKQVTRRITSRFYDALLDGGWLFVGHAESSSFVDPRFVCSEFPGTIVYRKDVSAAEPAGVPSGGRRARPDSVRSGHFSGLAERWAHRRPAQTAVEAVAAEEPGVPKEAPAKGTSAVILAPARVLIQRAQDAHAAGDMAKAQKLAREAAEKNPLLPEVYYILASVARQRAETEVSLELLRKCLYLDRTFLPGQLAMAEVLLDMGRSHEARRALESVVKLSDDRSAAPQSSRAILWDAWSLRDRALLLLAQAGGEPMRKDAADDDGKS
ncbi:MAG: CheR family methyltransferase [Planctomycetota bacterium]